MDGRTRRIISNASSDVFAFPLIIITWLPINIVALFDRKQTWEPVKHTSNISMAELTEKTNV